MACFACLTSLKYILALVNVKTLLSAAVDYAHAFSSVVTNPETKRKRVMPAYLDSMSDWRHFIGVSPCLYLSDLSE